MAFDTELARRIARATEGQRRVARRSGRSGRTWVPAVVAVLSLAILVPLPSASALNGSPAPVHLDIGSDGSIDADFWTIQDAVDAASDGDTVLADPGTYTEQVVINVGITVRATTPGTAAIHAPPFASRSTFTIPSSGRTWDAIIEIKDGDDASVEGFVIDGNEQGGFCSGRTFTGIMMHGGEGMAVRDNTVVRIRDTPLSGCQAGLAIAAYPDEVGLPASAVISGNRVADYQKGGIVANVEGMVAEVTDNVVAGVGATPLIAQNGIQFGFGAGGSAAGNTVSGHTYTGGLWVSAGILLYEAADDTTIAHNTLASNQAGVYVFGSVDARVEYNTLTATGLGIVAEGSDGAKIRSNTIGTPAPVPNMDEVIGIWAIGSAGVSVAGNRIDFEAAVPPVPVLYGISFEDSSGTIDDNDVFSVRMAEANFGLQTGVGIVATGTGAVTIEDNLVANYQKGGIVVGRVGNGLDNDPVTAYIRDNAVIGRGPTAAIAQNGIQVADTAWALIEGNTVSANKYTGGGDVATGILVYLAAPAVTIADNDLVNNQAGIYLFESDDPHVIGNEISVSALGIVVDTSDDALVAGNRITEPTVVPNEPEVIGIWVIGSAGAAVKTNLLDFGGALGDVPDLYGISFEDSSGTILGNNIRGVRMAPASLGLQTGIGILAVGTGNLDVLENTVTGYQKGGIVAGRVSVPLVGIVNILDNTVIGLGPTPAIAQNGIQVTGAEVSGLVRGNSIAGNEYTGCSSKDAAKTGCIPWVAVGLLLYNVHHGNLLKTSMNTFRDNQRDLYLLIAR